MDDKQQLITDIIRCMRRIINKHTSIDEIPLRFDDKVVLSPREIRTVELVGQRGAMNITEVAEHYHFTKSAASQLVARLEKMGFIRKMTSAHSNKEIQLSLTAQGQKAYCMFDAMMKEHMEEFYRRIGAFSLQQVSTAAVLLEVMESIVDERLKKLQ